MYDCFYLPINYIPQSMIYELEQETVWKCQMQDQSSPYILALMYKSHHPEIRLGPCKLKVISILDLVVKYVMVVLDRNEN